MINIKNKRGDLNLLLISLLLALLVGGFFTYRYFITNGTLFEKIDNIWDVKTSCQSYCYSLQSDNYCHSSFNLKSTINEKNILFKGLTCNFLSNLQENNQFKISKCDSIQCNDLILQNNQNEYQMQEACYNKENTKINRIYSLDDQFSYTLKFTNCFDDSSLECSSTPNFEGIKISVDSLEIIRKNVFNTMGLCVNYNSLGGNCWEAVNAIYSKSQVVASCIYSDNTGKSYLSVSSIKTSLQLPFLVASSSDSCLNYNLNEKDKLALLKTGDIISYIWDKKTGHNAIFIEWVDKSRNIAKLFDWNGQNHAYRYYEEDISDKKHPIYMIWEPKQKYSSTLV